MRVISKTDGPPRFESESLVIAGAARGLGAAIAERSAAEAANLLLADLNENAGKIADSLRGRGGEIVSFGGDVTSQADNEAMAAQAGARFDRLDVLVNNAAVGVLGAVTGLRRRKLHYRNQSRYRWHYRFDRSAEYSSRICPISEGSKMSHLSPRRDRRLS